MNKKRILSGAAMVILSAALFTGCGQKSSVSDQSLPQVSSLKNTVPVKKQKNGGEVKVGIISDSPLTNIFDDLLTNNAPDREALQFGTESLFGFDDQFTLNNKGPAKLRINLKNKTVTVEIKKNVKWSDGKPVTAKDYEYAYEVVANPKSTSPSYTSSLAEIVGIEKYHTGQEKTIAGIKMPAGPNGRKVVLHYQKMEPGMTQAGNGYFLQLAEPYHYLKNIPIAQLAASKEIRQKPIFYGPYTVKKVIADEKVIWQPNQYYWRGRPKLDQITASVVSSKTATQALKSGRFDVINVVNSDWQAARSARNVNFIKRDPLQYNYLAFKVGKWQNGKNVMDKDAKMNNRSLRRAMAYAMNTEKYFKQAGNETFNLVHTLIPEQYGDFSDTQIKGYSYNLTKANHLLDQAGYKRVGKYRRQPNGKKLTINLATDPSYELLARNYLQQWHKIGLNVKLLGGRGLDNKVIIEKLQNNDPQIDLLISGWVLPFEPSPENVYGEKAAINYSRFVSKKNNQLLQQINSLKSFNHHYRVQKFHEWQRYMNNEAYVLPLYNSTTITAVNKHLTGYSYKHSHYMGDFYPNWYYISYAK